MVTTQEIKEKLIRYFQSIHGFGFVGRKTDAFEKAIERDISHLNIYEKTGE